MSELYLYQKETTEVSWSAQEGQEKLVVASPPPLSVCCLVLVVVPGPPWGAAVAQSVERGTPEIQRPEVRTPSGAQKSEFFRVKNVESRCRGA